VAPSTLPTQIVSDGPIEGTLLTDGGESGMPRVVESKAGRIRPRTAAPFRGALGIALVLAFLVFPGQSPLDARAQVVSRPNVLVVLTDDQMIGALARGMPYLSSEPGGHWVSFTNAFVHYPLCCPSRATILSGLYAHHHGVQNNSGGRLNDSSTIATWLDQAGYETALVGKYLNGYPFSNRPDNYIPPGWDQWFAFRDQAYYDYQLNENGTWVSYGSTAADYSTDVLAGKAHAFLSSAAEPFFLYFSTQAPHQSFTPAPRHKGILQGLPITRSPNFNEADVSDKPAWVRNLPLFTASEEDGLDRGQRTSSETLFAVDEAIKDFMDTLSARGIIDNTVIMFMTDNGLSYGSHRWAHDKRCVYEECIRTPLLIRYPWTQSRTESRLSVNTDIAPTIAELAGISMPYRADGMSLVPLLTNSATDWRSSFLIEYQESIQTPPTFWAVRTDTWKYAELSTGERELYDLASDPYELANVANHPAYAEVQASLAAELQRLKSEGGPPPANRPPVAGDDSFATMQDTTLSVAAPGVLANDSDADGNPLSSSKISDPAHGTVTLSATGSFTYAPAAGFNGTDSFSYRASDGTAQSNTATVTITVSASGGGSSLILAPSDDATVKQAFPTSVFNDASLIVRKGSNSAHSYLKFTVTGLAGAPSAAKLRLFVTDPSPIAGPIYTASNATPSGTAWSESTVTWNTKPAIGTSALSSLGAVSTGSWVEYDLKNSITGNGTYSFALTGGSSDHAFFSSSEGGNLPQLVVTP
jgi:N-acetylglucosamine-6-sulfatase